MTKIDAEAGFTPASFKYVEEAIAENKKKGKQLLFALSFDEMKIMRYRIF